MMRSMCGGWRGSGRGCRREMADSKPSLIGPCWLLAPSHETAEANPNRALLFGDKGHYKRAAASAVGAAAGPLGRSFRSRLCQLDVATCQVPRNGAMTATNRSPPKG